MLKALFKKQMLEMLGQSVLRNRKTGQKRSPVQIVLFLLLYLVAFWAVAIMFYSMASTLCEPLVSVGFDWLFFAIMGLIAIAFGVFGSVFNTYTALYRSKDNDLLLSMPIPPSMLLFVRLTGVALLGFLFEALVFVQAIIAYNRVVGVRPGALLFQILLLLLLDLIVTALTCFLGWLVALIAGRLKNKTFATVALSLIFLGAYYYVYGSAYRILASILENPEGVGTAFRSWLFPFYAIGQAAVGNPLYLLVVLLIAGVLFGLTCFILARTFLKIATGNRGAAKTVYREKAVKAGNIRSALLFKEMKRFVSSSTYMLNCGLGIVIMLILPVVALIKMGAVRDTLDWIFPRGSEYFSWLPLIAAGIICLLVSMNDITAPSISLEGRSLWILQSFPVRPWDALAAKLQTHLLLAWIPALIDVVVLVFVARIGFLDGILILAAVSAFVLLTAASGLALNLLMPNLTWTNENVPVKQSPVVFLMLFGGMALIGLLAFLYVPLQAVLTPTLYLAALFVVFVLLDFLLLLWLRKAGAKRFASLG